MGKHSPGPKFGTRDVPGREASVVAGVAVLTGAFLGTYLGDEVTYVRRWAGLLNWSDAYGLLFVLFCD